MLASIAVSLCTIANSHGIQSLDSTRGLPESCQLVSIVPFTQETFVSQLEHQTRSYLDRSAAYIVIEHGDKTINVYQCQNAFPESRDYLDDNAFETIS